MHHVRYDYKHDLYYQQLCSLFDKASIIGLNELQERVDRLFDITDVSKIKFSAGFVAALEENRAELARFFAQVPPVFTDLSACNVVLEELIKVVNSPDGVEDVVVHNKILDKLRRRDLVVDNKSEVFEKIETVVQGMIAHVALKSS